MNEPHIEVGIMAEPEVQLFFQGKYDTNGITVQGACFVYVKNSLLQLKQANDELFSCSEIILRPFVFADCNFLVKGVTIGVDFHWQQKEDQRFQGDLILCVEEGKVRVINRLPVEDYLLCVISSEMRADCSLELLKAHAIISRSWLLAQVHKQNKVKLDNTTYDSFIETEQEYMRWWDREDHVSFHVCADDHCQRYQGISRSANANVERAIRETKGLVLTHDGEIADARYSKCCGGVSERFENCWEPIHYTYLESVVDNADESSPFVYALHHEENARKWLKSSPDAFCNTTDVEVLRQVLNDYDWSAPDFYRWKVKYTASELSALIKKRSGKDFGIIEDLFPMERGVSGRIIRLEIVGTKKRLVVGKELAIRRWLSDSHLYSSAFVVDKKMDESTNESTFEITGGGWGHGVGLCQIGAAVMGHRGYSFSAILKYYFHGVAISDGYGEKVLL